MSKYEEYIALILKQEKIKFEREKSFNDLKHGLFRFDFLCAWGGSKVLLEIDGQQHFQQVQKFQRTRSEFLKTQAHDRAKNSYCLAHKIQLYRIPYWEIPYIKTATELFAPAHLVKTKWHNDELWRDFQKKSKS